MLLGRRCVLVSKRLHPFYAGYPELIRATPPNTFSRSTCVAAMSAIAVKTRLKQVQEIRTTLDVQLRQNVENICRHKVFQKLLVNSLGQLGFCTS